MKRKPWIDSYYNGVLCINEDLPPHERILRTRVNNEKKWALDVRVYAPHLRELLLSVEELRRDKHNLMTILAMKHGR